MGFEDTKAMGKDHGRSIIVRTDTDLDFPGFVAPL